MVLTEIKKLNDKFNHRLDTIKERINKLGYRAVEIILNAAQREKEQKT